MLFRHAAACLLLAVSSTTLPMAVTAQAAFTYNPADPNGPGGWANIPYPEAADGSPTNQCAGQENSPIAIEDTGCQDFTDYIMRAGSCTNSDMVFEVNDHTVKASFEGDCERPNLEIPGVEGVFDAVQFHIHTGSEHTVDGITFGAELHIVHYMRDCPEVTQRCYAVVGTKLNPASSQNNPLFSIFLEGWIKIHNDEEIRCGNTGNIINYDTVTDDNTLIDPYQFNRGNRFFHYEGGLTTPPCSEVVWWNLDDAPLAISVEQYTDLGRVILDYKDANCTKATVAHHGSTSRPTQPLNGRTVKKICPKAYAPHSSYFQTPSVLQQPPAEDPPVAAQPPQDPPVAAQPPVDTFSSADGEGGDNDCMTLESFADACMEALSSNATSTQDDFAGFINGLQCQLLGDVAEKQACTADAEKDFYGLNLEFQFYFVEAVCDHLDDDDADEQRACKVGLLGGLAGRGGDFGFDASAIDFSEDIEVFCTEVLYDLVAASGLMQICP